MSGIQIAIAAIISMASAGVAGYLCFILGGKLTVDVLVERSRKGKHFKHDGHMYKVERVFGDDLHRH